MEKIILDILNVLRDGKDLDEQLLAKIIHAHNSGIKDNKRHHAKKKLLPYYLKVKQSDQKRWISWDINDDLEVQLIKTLQVKPRRTASGVATITVITKPWKCSSNCLYCPNDLRMPKSYLSDEPACQRAERNYFDPYLQVASRLRALTHMGHATDKIELIILGGTWSDYSKAYQIWFVKELFRALNDGGDLRCGEDVELSAKLRRKFYKDAGLSNDETELHENVASEQQKIDKGETTYNQAMQRLYKDNAIWQKIAHEQTASLDELYKQHKINESTTHRVVGLVVETRPDVIDCDNLTLLRQLGCTKVQIGVQSLSPEILYMNNRGISVTKIQEAFELLRLFGFKIHAHFMVNLYGSSVEADKQDFKRFVTEKPFQPDEVKLYPCSLVNGTGLCAHYSAGSWRPYSEDELIDILVADVIATPPFIRISRMIRDISAKDIMVGNKKTNLRQMVEAEVRKLCTEVSEIRFREIASSETDIGELRLDDFTYETTATVEHFLQWVTPANKIAGFLRLSLPKQNVPIRQQAKLPFAKDEAMIREVHIYGKVAKISAAGENAQHLGLGKQLIESACVIAVKAGCNKMNVISSVGTREYYRNLGFEDNKLYQRRTLNQG